LQDSTVPLKRQVAMRHKMEKSGLTASLRA
jgi:hypothetical protein